MSSLKIYILKTLVNSSNHESHEKVFDEGLRTMQKKLLIHF